MTRMTYGEQLKHPNWQRKRLEVLQRASWRCESCSSGDVTLHVHHKRYIKGRLAWEYELSNFLALCEPCHEDHHEEREKLNRVLAEVTPQQLPDAVSLLVGWLHPMLDLDTQAECSSDPYATNIGALARAFDRAKFNIHSVCELAECLGFVEFDERLKALVKELHHRAIGLDDA